jgi:fatty acid desaturase
VNLLYHVEHHLFPAVPCNHLPELARRLDGVAPEWTGKRVLRARLTLTTPAAAASA